MTTIRLSGEILPGLPGNLKSLDLGSDGQWVAVVGNGEREWLVSPDRVTPLPFGCPFAILRVIDADRVVVVCEGKRERCLARTLRLDGMIDAVWETGSQVEHVAVVGDVLAFTYSDEAFHDLAAHGIALFGLDGRYLGGYRDALGADAVDIVDCYAVCSSPDGSIWFLPYQHFPLVRFTPSTLAQTIYETPRALHGSQALTSRGDVLFFHSPYDARGAILSWSPGDTAPVVIGQYDGWLRGLPGGRFLTHGKDNYIVMTVV